MLYLLAFNGLMLLLAVGVGRGLVSLRFIDGFITGLHSTIGIRTQTPDLLRRIVIVWIVSIAVIVDALFGLLRWVI